MRPSEVPARDWHLYFNGTIMRHDEHGIVNVQVSEQHIYWKRVGRQSWIPAEPGTLSCVWPTCGAVNYDGRAMFVGRRSRREARRSASMNHYYIGWDGTATESGTINGRLLRYLCYPDPYPSFEFSVEALRTGARHSVAVTPELIMLPHSEGVAIVYKSDSAGVLKIGEENEFIPTVNGSPASRRAIFRLRKEGWLCH